MRIYLIVGLSRINCHILIKFASLFIVLCSYITVLHATLLPKGWSWESIRGWWQFLKLGIPGMAMICLEWVSYEIVVFVLGSIGEVELAINSILVNLLVIMFMVRQC